MRDKLLEFLDDLKFFLRILTWREYWTVIGVVLGVVGIWLLFYVALTLDNPWRSIIMWGLLLGLAAFSTRR
jgi:uncharacterized BrkB/YihY/UPF0761 family membrane protein